MSFGKIIQIRREKLNLSRKQLADEVNTTQSYIWELENGKVSSPSAQLIIDIAKVLQLNPEDIIPSKAKVIATANPEGIEDRVFYRKYKKLTNSDQEKITKILDILDTSNS